MEMHEMFASMNERSDQLTNNHVYEHREGSKSVDPGGRSRTNINGGTIRNNSEVSYLSRMVKLDFLRFNGTEDPTIWICRAGQFF